MRRHFQFSLRALLVVTLVAAISCDKLRTKIEEKRREREIIKTVEGRFGWVAYEWELARGSNPPKAEPPGWWLFRKIVGDDFFAAVTILYADSRVADADLATIAMLPDLEEVWLCFPPVSFNLKNPETNARLTDAGLRHLKQLPKLTSIHIFCTAVTDAGIADLRQALPNCRIRHYR
jgi:hypothetical protein